MRLIDADALREALNKSDRDARTEADIQGYCDGWNDVVEIINDQPTAYNVDAVVAEIQKKYCQRCRNILSVPGAEEYCKRQKCRIYEICDIVKAGGING